MSHTGRAVYNAMYEPWNLTPAQRAFVEQGEREGEIDDRFDDSKPTTCPADAPTDAEWREHYEAATLSHRPTGPSDLYDTIAEMIF